MDPLPSDLMNIHESLGGMGQDEIIVVAILGFFVENFY
jgi:hypothetical protein